MRYIISIIVSIVLVLSCKNTIKEPIDTDTYYTCSMDPQVVEYKPGTCPICKMDLTPVKKRKGESQGELELSDQQIQLGNIQVDTIRNGTIGDQLILTASLNFDQSKLYAVSSRVMGRVEKLN